MARVLIVEDSDGVYEVFALALREDGHFVHRSRGIKSSVEKLALSPDIVILDIALGEENGMWVARALRDASFSGPIFIITSGVVPPTEIGEIDIAGILQKPILPSAIVAVVDQYVGGNNEGTDPKP